MAAPPRGHLFVPYNPLVTAARAYSRGWLAAATAVSAALILGAPYIGQLRTFIRTLRRSGSFPPSCWPSCVGAVAVALVFAITRIRSARCARVTARWPAAVLIGVGYAMVTATGNPDVDAVERFHFVEYGLITALFYRTWRPAGDDSVIVMPVLAGLLVGTLEEWFQWFIPARVGEVRDVFLNLVAITQRSAVQPGPRSAGIALRRTVGRVAAESRDAQRGRPGRVRRVLPVGASRL